MRAALIPPMGAEYTVLSSDIHLVLPMIECRMNRDYVEAYRQAWRRGDYIILDNGVAEGKLISNAILLRFAREIRAHELVAPDVLGNGPETLRRTHEFVRFAPDVQNYSIMGVLQGKDIKQVLQLAEAYSKMSQITAVGIPKIHVTHVGDDIRLRLAENIHKVYGDRFEIHLLGLSRFYQAEMLDLHFPPYVRSMDSAQPYKYAEEGISMTGVNVTEYHPQRRSDYFAAPKKYDTGILRQNIETFLQWARADES